MPTRNRRRSNELLVAYGFMMPAAILVTVLMYWPMFETFRESLYSSSFINPTPEFVGLATYEKILSDPVFWQILRNSVVWTLGVVLLQILQNLVNLLGIPSSLNFAVMGTVILLGVIADRQFMLRRQRLDALARVEAGSR